MEGEAHNCRDIKTKIWLPQHSNDYDRTLTTMNLKLQLFFTSQENFARFLIIESKNKEKPVASLSPFVIEKQIEAQIGTAKSVKKLKNGTLLVETTRKTQTENLKKLTSFFGVPVEVTEHNTLNSSKGIIRNPILKSETEDNILEYLKPQGVTHVKRFTIRKNHEIVNTNTLLLTFNSVINTQNTQNLLPNNSG